MCRLQEGQTPLDLATQEDVRSLLIDAMPQMATIGSKPPVVASNSSAHNTSAAADVQGSSGEGDSRTLPQLPPPQADSTSKFLKLFSFCLNIFGILRTYSLMT